MATPKSALVNFRALEEDSSNARRGELLRNIVALLGIASDSCGPELLNSYDSVMVKLADMVEPNVRADVAAKLAELRRAPNSIIHKLALDEIEVAQPIIIRSPLLSDDDLIGIAEIRGPRHRRAIAARPGIGELVSEVLALRGDDGTRRALAANVTARLATASLDILLAQARRDPEMQELLAEHPETTAEALTELLEFAGDKARGVAARRAVERVGTTSQARPMPVDQLISGYDFDAARVRVERRSHGKVPTVEFAGRLASENEFPGAAIALSEATGFELVEVLHWFAECDAHVLLVVAKAFEANERDFCRLLNAGPIRFRLSASERNSALEAFRALEIDAARLILAKRREERVRR